jgi:hypothetical protein
MRTLLVLTLCLTGCATTLDSVWRSPDLRAHKIATFAVFGQARQPTGRVAFEQALTNGLQARGLLAVPGYTFVAFDEKPEQSVIVERLKSKNVEAVLVSRIVGRDAHPEAYPEWVGGPADPYYYGWYGYMGTYGPYYAGESVEYTVETVLYDVQDKKPLWAARSTTTRKSPTDFADDIAGPMADELEAAGLVSRGAPVRATPAPP